MPTFKSNFPEYNPAATEKDNLINLFENFRNFATNVTMTINNLDDENLNDEIVSILRGGQTDEPSNS